MSTQPETPVWKPKAATRVVHSGLTLMHGEPVGMHLSEHEHDEVQLEMHFNQERSSNGTKLDMKAGFFNLIPARMPHVGEWKDETEVIVALIARPQMEGAAEELLSKGEPEAVNVVCGADPLFQSFSTLMREEFLAGRATDTLLVEATGTILSAWLVRRWSGVRNERRIRGTLSRKQLERTLELVKDRFSGSLQVADLAGELGMGVHQFTRHFRESVGCTPYRYIIDQRVERARYLLTATSLPIAEIAIEAGFVSQSHLTETFQRRLNITPNVLRKSI